MSCFSHRRIRSSKGLLYGETRIACVLTRWSSSSCSVSSIPCSTYVPVSLYDMHSSSTAFQSAFILSSARSSVYSCAAIFEIASMVFPCDSTPRSIMPERVMLGSGRILIPVVAESSSQWRSRIPTERSCVTRCIFVSSWCSRSFAWSITARAISTFDSLCSSGGADTEAVETDQRRSFGLPAESGGDEAAPAGAPSDAARAASPNSSAAN